MGLRTKKSFTITKGVRMNIGKNGVGVSFGTKGLRYSINSNGRKTATVGIPGTGISYSKSLGKANNRSIYSQSTKNTNQNIADNQKILEEYDALVEYIKSIHKNSDEYIDWEYIHLKESPFDCNTIGPEEEKATRNYESFKPNFFDNIFKSSSDKKKEKLRQEIYNGRLKDKENYEEWMNLNKLSKKIIDGDIDAYFYVIEDMKPFDDLLDLGSDFEVSTNNPKLLEVEFRVKSESVVPNYVLSLTKTGKVSNKSMTKTNYYDLVQDYVCSCSIRVARDIMAILPVEKVLVHAIDSSINTSKGYEEEITILSVEFNKNIMKRLNFQAVDPSDALQNFRHNMKFLKTSGLKGVDRLKSNDNGALY